MNILDAIGDAEVFGPWFKRGDWRAWQAFLAALFGLRMTRDQLAIYRACTGRKAAPAAPFGEAALIIGRRGGKSFTLALIAVFAATFRDYREYLQPGERATVMIIAADRKQARVIMRYIVALLEGIPMLAGLIERQTTEAIDLRRSVSIEVMTANFRTIRGYSVPVALLDELAFWQGEDSANPDAEIIAALRPAMATMPGAMMLMASSPYARRGELWRAYKAHHGREGAPMLVWQAATRTMNPSIPQSVIDEAMDRDPASAAAEYGAQFRTDVETLLTREAVENCVDPGILERPPVRGVSYLGFVDPSGGSADSMTLAIGHREEETAVIDAVREVRPPFSPANVVGEFAAVLRSYGLRSVTGDRWGGEFVREPFRKAGVDYRLAPVAASDLYRDLVAVVNSGRLALLDHARLQAQLVGLERRVGRGGRDSISHPPGAHDDLANAVSGVASLLLSRARPQPVMGRAAREESSTARRNPMGMMEVIRLVSGAKGRLGSMRGSIDRLDKEISELEGRRAKADPSEAWQINQRIRELSEQRTAGGEIVAEAERQAADASAKLVEANKAALATMHKTTAECRRAAERFDSAIADALGALEELEAAAAPIEHVLIPGTMRRHYTTWPNINQAVQAGLKVRMGRMGETLKAATLREQIDLMVAAVHENATTLKSRGNVW